MKIFIVDVDPITNQTLSRFLTNLNHEVCSLNNPLKSSYQTESYLSSIDFAIVEQSCFNGANQKRSDDLKKWLPEIPKAVIINKPTNFSVEEAMSNNVFTFFRQPVSLVELELFLLRFESLLKLTRRSSKVEILTKNIARTYCYLN